MRIPFVEKIKAQVGARRAKQAAGLTLKMERLQKKLNKEKSWGRKAGYAQDIRNLETQIDNLLGNGVRLSLDQANAIMADED